MPQNFVYEFRGRTLRSTLKLDELSPAESFSPISPALPPIYVGMGLTPIPPLDLLSDNNFIWTDPNATMSVHKSGEYYALVFPNLAVFSVNPEAAEVLVYSSTDEGTLSHLLLDQVLPRLLAWSGEIVLHAGAVSFDNIGIAFLGESGHGKSSLTASFMQNGACVLSDDAIILNQNPRGLYAYGLYPSLRLWPTALDGLVVAASQTSELAHYSTKRRVRLQANAANDQPQKLNAIFTLQMERANSDITITSLSDREVMMALIEGSFRLDPTAQPQGQNFFKRVDEIKNNIKGYRLCYPHGYHHLPAVRAAITANLKENA